MAERRPLLTAILVGAGLGVATVAIVFGIIAMPFFALAQMTEPDHGLDRPFIRNGLFRVAVPVGVVAGIAAAVAVARWYRRGGRLSGSGEYPWERR